MVSERTPLRNAEGGGPPYIFMTNPNKLYRKQIHQFQCFICASFLILFAAAVVISVMHEVKEDTIDKHPIEDDNTSIEPLLSLSWPISDKGVPKWQSGTPSDADIQEALVTGQLSLSARDDLENDLPPLPSNTASFKHQKSIRTSPRAQFLSRTGYVMDIATKTIVSKSPNVYKKGSVGRTAPLSEAFLSQDVCGPHIQADCQETEYRTADGSCNNPKHPYTWGVAMQPFRRTLPPDYADGVSAPRVASDGSELPSARDVSVAIHRPEYRDDPKFTVMLAVWGQFLDHDISATALSQGKDGSTIPCCTSPPEKQHPECYPVKVSSSDPHFNTTCLEFVRSAPAPTCSLGPREQLNQASSYIDGSVVYGSTYQVTQSLRSYQNGQLRMTVTPDGRELLPISSDPNDGCNREEENAKGRYCFASGDPRANENIHLTTMHLMLARQHNLVASELSSLNPSWGDEKVFQETRKIVAAQMQHITYNEFLPVLLGPTIMKKLDITPKKDGYYSGYDASVDPSISNSFATASFRFAHTLLPGMMKVLNASKEELVELHKVLFNPYKLYTPGYLDSTILGAVNTPLERMDNYFTKEVTQKLFQQPSKPCGLDLVSLNVQRGRDHGLPAYPEWRELCGLSKPTTFDDLKGHVDEDSLTRMSTMYKSVDDVDLYTGALSELPLEGGMLGATLTCLITDQFKRIKMGDRYWYETPQQPQAFTPEQLSEIRKTSLASLICDTADNVTNIQNKVMESVGVENERSSCSSLPKLDLTLWADTGKPNLGFVKFVKGPKSPAASKWGTKTKITSTAVAVTVKSGSIKTEEGDILWDGEFPVAIPASLFKRAKTVTSKLIDTQLAPIMQFGHGIQWAGTVDPTNGTLTVNGTFSFPIYQKDNTSLYNFSVNWVNGEFALDSDLIWNNSDVSSIVLSDTYSSSVFFSEAPLPKLTKKLNKRLEFILAKPKLNAPGPIVPIYPVKPVKTPIILNGTYSPDKTIFYWNGNATVMLPVNKTATEPSPVKLTSSPVTSSNVTKTRAGFKITGGSITLNKDDASQEFLWTGTLPVAIPSKMFNLKALAPTSDILSPFVNPLYYLHGAIWTASSETPTIKGTFSFPFYDYSLGYNVTWTNGEFSFEVEPSWNLTLDGLITPGMKYFSRIFFTPATVLNTSVLEMVHDSPVHEPSSIQTFVKDGLTTLDGYTSAPIILQGTFSPDKSVFYWSGSGLISIKTIAKDVNTQMVMLRSAEPSAAIWSKTRFGGTVTGGYVKTAEETLWGGSLPLAISVPSIWSHSKISPSFTFSLGISWSGSLTGNTLEGEFSFPQFTGNLTYSSISWQNGSFSLQFQPLWATPLSALFVPGAKYYSKVMLQGNKWAEDVAPALEELSKESKLQEINTAMYAPIILQGTYSLDRNTFYWTGNIIIAFRNSFTQSYNFIPARSVLKAAAPVTPRASVKVTVTSGSLSVSPLKQDTPLATWDGELPAKIPLEPLISKEFYHSQKITDAIWTGKITGNTIKGSFTMPTYIENGTAVWYAGNYSFNFVPPLNTGIDTVLKSGKKYTTKIIFREKEGVLPNVNDLSIDSKSLESFGIDGQSVIDDAQMGFIILLGKFYSRPFYCPAFLCNDQKLFYWSGDAVISVPNQKFVKFVKSPAPKPSITSSSQFGGQVLSGNLEVFTDETNVQSLWTGKFPMDLPANVFSPPPEVDSPSSKFNIMWSGSYENFTLTGNFTFPKFVWTGMATDVQWWNGRFSFNTVPLWFVPLESILVPGRKYTTQVFFQGSSKPLVSSSIDVANATYFVPIILQGYYSPDKTVFTWTGKFITSFRKPSFKSEEENLTLMATASDGDVDGDNIATTKAPKPIKPPKPTKAPKAPKPPKPLKVSITFTVESGSMWAGFDKTNVTNVWNGNIPIKMTVDNFLLAGEFTPTAQVAWSGSADEEDIEGTFTMPYHFKNGTVTIKKQWGGNFTAKYQVKYTGDMQSFIKKKESYTCKVMFKEFGQKSYGPNYSAKSSPGVYSGIAKSTQYKGIQKAPKVDVDMNKLGKPTACNILLVGEFYKKPFYCPLLPFLCTDATIFTWSGEAIMTYTYPPSASPTNLPETVAPPNLNLMAIGDNTFAGNSYRTQRKIIGKVLSGTMSAGLSGTSKKTLWSGTLPAEIPLPVFWVPATTSVSDVPDTEPEAYAHGVIWSGSMFGSTVKCSFHLPQYVWNGIKTSERWWSGDFNVHIQSLWDIGLGGLIIPGLKYYTRIIFRDMRTFPITNDPLLSFGTPTQEEINGAYKAPLILLGTYSADRKTFYWSGNFILVFRNLPSAYMYDFNLPAQPPVYPALSATMKNDESQEESQLLADEMGTRLSLSSPPVQPNQNNLKAIGDNTFGTDFNRTPRKIIGKVLGGSLSAGLYGTSKTTLWSGTLPAEIPLPVFWAPVTPTDPTIPGSQPESYAHGAIWTGSMFGSTVKCSFHLPQYTWNGMQSSQRWWSGDFKVHIQSLWDIGLGGLIIPGVRYYSRIVFRDLRTYSASNEPLLSAIPTQEEVNNAYKAPLILLGTYSADRKTFYWSGDFVLVFRNLPFTYMNDFALPPQASSHSLLGTKEIESSESQKQLATFSSSLGAATDTTPDASAPATTTTGRKIVGKVLSGSLSAGLSIFSKTVLWSGQFPTEISLPIFWAPTKAKPDKEPDAYSHGAIWSATIFGSTVKCSFYLPQYTFDGATTSMRWWKGEFMVHIESLWDIGLGELITPGFKYYSIIVFRDIKNTDKLLKSAPSQNDVNSAYRAPLILLGRYATDKKTFYWSGDFILSFGDLSFTIPPVQPLLTSTADLGLGKSSKSSKSFAITVKSGSIKANKEYQDDDWWTGLFPVTLPLNRIYTKSKKNLAVELSITGSIENSIFSGEFALPEYVQNDENSTVNWFNGKYSFIIAPIWNSTLDGVLETGTNYTTRLLFKQLDDYSDVSDDFAVKPSKSKSKGSYLSIVLLGYYSPDNYFFTWMGQALINFLH